MTTETGLKSQRGSGLSLYITYAGVHPRLESGQGHPGLDNLFFLPIFFTDACM